MLKIGTIRWRGRCTKHPGYDPVIDGLGGIRGGCRRCQTLLEIHTHHGQLVRLMREFGNQEQQPQRAQTEDDRQMSLLDLT